MAGPFVGENADLEAMLRDLEQRRDRRVGTLDISDIISSVPVVQIKVLSPNKNKVRTSSGSGSDVGVEPTHGMEQGEVMIFHLWEDSGLDAAVEMADEPTQRGTTTTTVENRDMPRSMRFTVKAADGTDVPRVTGDGIQSQDDMTMRQQISNLLNLRGAKVQAVASKPGLVLTGLVRNVSVQDQGTHDNVTTVSVEVRETTAQGGDAKGKRFAEKARFQVPVQGEDDGQDDPDDRSELGVFWDDAKHGGERPPAPHADFGGRCVMRALPSEPRGPSAEEVTKRSAEIIGKSILKLSPAYQLYKHGPDVVDRIVGEAALEPIPRKPIGEAPAGGETYVTLDSLGQVTDFRRSSNRGDESAVGTVVRDRVLNKMRGIIGGREGDPPHFLRDENVSGMDRLEIVIYEGEDKNGNRVELVQEALVEEIIGTNLGTLASVTNAEYGEC